MPTGRTPSLHPRARERRQRGPRLSFLIWLRGGKATPTIKMPRPSALEAAHSLTRLGNKPSRCVPGNRPAAGGSLSSHDTCVGTKYPPGKRGAQEGASYIRERWSSLGSGGLASVGAAPAKALGTPTLRGSLGGPGSGSLAQETPPPSHSTWLCPRPPRPRACGPRRRQAGGSGDNKERALCKVACPSLFAQWPQSRRVTPRAGTLHPRVESLEHSDTWQKRVTCDRSPAALLPRRHLTLRPPGAVPARRETLRAERRTPSSPCRREPSAHRGSGGPQPRRPGSGRD